MNVQITRNEEINQYSTWYIEMILGHVSNLQLNLESKKRNPQQKISYEISHEPKLK